MMKAKPLIKLMILSTYFMLLNEAAAACEAAITESTPTSEFTSHADGTVTHSQTGLMWKVCTEGQTWANNSCTGTTTTHTWQQALQIPQTLNVAGGYANKTDWRLPNIKELGSIVEEQCEPTINSGIFPSTPSVLYWSSSFSPRSSTKAFIVDFDRGVGSDLVRTNSYSVRLVRGEQ